MSDTGGQRGQDLERGSASLWVLIGSLALFAVLGLVYDGAAKVSAARVASVSAAEAARAAGQSMTPTAITSGQPQAAVDPARGAQAARSYLAAAGVSGTVSVSGDAIRVTTAVPWRPRFIPAPGQSLTGTATATRTSIR